MKDSPERQYTKEWLQFDRPQPMYDSSLNSFYGNLYKTNIIHNSDMREQFITTFLDYLKKDTLNNLTGFGEFKRLDFCMGCTQFIDDLYARIGPENVMIFEGDYKYHWRMHNDITYTTLDTLDSTKQLLISMPFPLYGDVHYNMEEVLDKCQQLNIPVHIDGAWVSCSKGITFNFDHPAIHSFAISLSKGGLASDRAAIKFTRDYIPSTITIMNDFNMCPRSVMHLAIEYMKVYPPGYFWSKYEKEYTKVCDDFQLTPTKAIHLASKNGMPVGVRPLLRYLKT